MKAPVRYFVLMMLISLPLWSEEYRVLMNGENSVTFSSKASIESFTGTTSQIDGYVLWEGADPLNENEFYLQVPLATLDTGIGLRNRHMRDNYLQTDKYPLAQYSGKMIRYEAANDSTYLVDVDGLFTLHGVEQKLTLQGKVTIRGDRLHVQAPIQLKLADYKVKIPKFMFLKISELIDIKVDFEMVRYTPK